MSDLLSWMTTKRNIFRSGQIDVRIRNHRMLKIQDFHPELWLSQANKYMKHFYLKKYIKGVVPKSCHVRELCQVENSNFHSYSCCSFPIAKLLTTSSSGDGNTVANLLVNYDKFNTTIIFVKAKWWHLSLNELCLDLLLSTCFNL